jgi:hypothetical protein
MIKEEKAEENREYYLSTKDSRGDFLIYASDIFRLSEIDIINLIKICLIEIRSKSIGKKILAVYRDSNQHRAEIVQEKLKMIGILDDGINKPEKERKPKLK